MNRISLAIAFLMLTLQMDLTFASKLRSLEKEATEKKSNANKQSESNKKKSAKIVYTRSRNQSSSYDSDDDSDYDSDLESFEHLYQICPNGFLIDYLFCVMVAQTTELAITTAGKEIGRNSTRAVEYTASTFNFEERVEGDRTPGELILPIVQVRIRGFSDFESISSRMAQVKLGAGPIGLKFNQQWMVEESDHLTLQNEMAYFRMPWARNFQVDFGLGRTKMKGEQTHVGNALGLEMTIMFNDEYYLSYDYTSNMFDGDPLNDLKLNIHYVKQRYGIEAGYQNLTSGEVSIHGVSAGLSWTF